MFLFCEAARFPCIECSSAALHLNISNNQNSPSPPPSPPPPPLTPPPLQYWGCSLLARCPNRRYPPSGRHGPAHTFYLGATDLLLHFTWGQRNGSYHILQLVTTDRLIHSNCAPRTGSQTTPSRHGPAHNLHLGAMDRLTAPPGRYGPANNLHLGATDQLIHSIWAPRTAL